MTSSSSIRIALFLCDKPVAAVQATDGDYTAIFDVLLRKSLPGEAAVDYVLDSYDVCGEQRYPENIADYQAIILTGSAASAYENVEWINRLVDYIRDVGTNKQHIKLIGVSPFSYHCNFKLMDWARYLLWSPDRSARTRRRVCT